MKILHNCIAGFLGYYGSLEALLSHYPEGGEAGSFFLNGETSTLWMWNPVTRCWSDTNYASAPDLVGMIIDPATFSPSIIEDKEALYYYVATTAGLYGFPKLPGTMMKIEVSCSQSSIILLHWDGSMWESHVYPISLSPLIFHRFEAFGAMMKPTIATTPTSMSYSTTDNTTALFSTAHLRRLHPARVKYGKLSTASRSLPPGCR